MAKQQKASKKTAKKTTKCALILAGGGQKVAFQAGVLQVWLDEAKLEFDHADGASGGLINLAMWCQGMSGTKIADNWRNYNPLRSIDPNWKQLWKLYWAASLLKYDRFRRNVLTDWGFDWTKINNSTKEATFNLYNFSQHQLELVSPKSLTEDLLISGISLPTWFEPIEVAGDQYIDSVYVTDANLDEAIARGADELWIIWTVSDGGIWRNGLIAHYFQIIEAAGNGPFNVTLQRIARNNAMIESGGEGEYRRKIEVRLLKAEVPLHYLLNFSRKKMQNAVNLGVETARQWCRDQGISLTVD
jgi:predicted acylesterase/phospholipase RssA